MTDPGPPPGPMPVPGPPQTPAAPAPAAGSAGLPDQPEGYQLTHRGNAHAVGYGPGFYGVWDLRTGGAPVAWFERTPMGWEAAWRRFQELEGVGGGGGGAPSWRRGQAGWVILHLLIGVGIWFAQLFLMGVVLVATVGEDRLREVRNLPDSESGSLGAAVLFALVASLAGWLLFVYLRSSAKLRALVLAGVVGASFAILVSVALSVVPD